jgi:hypothetical protein
MIVAMIAYCGGLSTRNVSPELSNSDTTLELSNRSSYEVVSSNYRPFLMSEQRESISAPRISIQLPAAVRRLGIVLTAGAPIRSRIID